MAETKVCVNCKPSKSAEEDMPLVAKTGCTADYFIMQSCMDKNQGNIASCRPEWETFRACYAKRPKDDGN